MLNFHRKVCGFLWEFRQATRVVFNHGAQLGSLPNSALKWDALKRAL